MNANSKINVLLVDDQPGKLLSYEVMLGELGENLIKTGSAKEALEVLLKTDVAVILIDVCMPELDGFELARMIRDHPRFQQTAIIFISAINISEADSLRGYDAGAVDYVPVPVVPEILRAKVRIFADLYRKTRMLEDLNRELETRVVERTAALEAVAARLIQTEQGRSLALAAGNMGSWDYNFQYDSWTIDEGQYRIFGLAPGATVPSDALVRSFFQPEDWERLIATLKAATRSDPTFQAELRIIRPTGEVRWCMVVAAATFDGTGNAHRVSGVTIDITERKEAERKQTLLAREVDHRARNALAVVQSIVRLGRASTVDEYVLGVEGRVRALALSHELLSQSRWQGADIARLVAEEFAPYQTGGVARAVAEGPSIILPADKAQSVALVIHELATNAAKYGALSVAPGTIHLTWSLNDGQLKMVWTEKGGPSVAAPATKGFGTRIIEASLNKQKGDTAAFEWRHEGLQCRIELSVVAHHEEISTQDIAAHPTEGKQVHILVVEDEALVGMLTSEIVNQMGYAVVGPCVGLKEAMKAASENSIDGAILDVNLGGEMVFPLARALKARAIPFIFLTGYERAIVDGDFAGIPVLQKPTPADDLKNALSLALSSRPGNKPVQVPA
ncbi:MAG TPA: response regulator [Rhizomicrobium sp.]